MDIPIEVYLADIKVDYLRGDFRSVCVKFERIIDSDEMQPYMIGNYAIALHQVAFKTTDAAEKEQLLFRAIDVLNRYAQTAGKTQKYYSALALGYFHLGFYDYAIYCYKKVLDFAPEDTTVFQRLGALYEYKNDAQQALQYYQRVLSTNDTNAETWYRAGYCYFKLNQPYTAIATVKKALLIRPDSDKYREFYEKLKPLCQESERVILN